MFRNYIFIYYVLTTAVTNIIMWLEVMYNIEYYGYRYYYYRGVQIHSSKLRFDHPISIQRLEK